MNTSDISAKRSLAVQMIMVGNEVEGLSQFKSYCEQLLGNFGNILGSAAPSIVKRIGIDLQQNATSSMLQTKNTSSAEVNSSENSNSNSDSNSSSSWMVAKSSSNAESEEILMNIFLTEVQGILYMYIYIYSCMYFRTHKYTCLYTYVYTCSNIHTYTFTNVLTHTFIHIRRSSYQ